MCAILKGNCNFIQSNINKDDSYKIKKYFITLYVNNASDTLTFSAQLSFDPMLTLNHCYIKLWSTRSIVIEAHY